MLDLPVRRNITLFQGTTTPETVFLTQGKRRTIVNLEDINSNLVEVTTSKPHLFQVGDWVKLAETITIPNINNSYRIAEVLSSTRFRIAELLERVVSQKGTVARCFSLADIELVGSIRQQFRLSLGGVIVSGKRKSRKLIVSPSVEIQAQEWVRIPSANLERALVTSRQILPSNHLLIWIDRPLPVSISQEPIQVPELPSASFNFSINNSRSGKLEFFLPLSEWEKIPLYTFRRINYHYDIFYRKDNEVLPLLAGIATIIPSVTNFQNAN